MICVRLRGLFGCCRYLFGLHLFVWGGLSIYLWVGDRCCFCLVSLLIVVGFGWYVVTFFGIGCLRFVGVVATFCGVCFTGCLVAVGVYFNSVVHCIRCSEWRVLVVIV